MASLLHFYKHCSYIVKYDLYTVETCREIIFLKNARVLLQWIDLGQELIILLLEH